MYEFMWLEDVYKIATHVGVNLRVSLAGPVSLGNTHRSHSITGLLYQGSATFTKMLQPGPKNAIAMPVKP